MIKALERVRVSLFRISLFGLALLLVNATPKIEDSHSKRESSGKSRPIASGYPEVPLYFETNQGQTDRQVRFLSRGPDFTLFLTSSEAVLSVRGPRVTSQDRAGGSVLRMKLLGGDPSPRLEGLEPLPGKSHYFIGNDPATWHLGVPHFRRVHYKGVYPGVDMVFYGNQRELEYDFAVSPGTDPGTIVLGFDGTQGLKIDASGDLLLKTPLGEVCWKKPLIYQQISGERTHVQGGYKLLGQNRVGFWIGDYDSTERLTIDPVLSYSTYLGGAEHDYGTSVTVDSTGIYVSGYTYSDDFPPVAGSYDISSNGDSDVFVTKLNLAGSALVYSTYLGGAAEDTASDIAVDGLGNVYVTGETLSSGFPATVGAFDTTLGGQSDVFVTVLNASGSGLLYSTYLGGNSSTVPLGDGFYLVGGTQDEGLGIAVDNAGHAYVTGWTNSPSFPTTAGVLQSQCEWRQQAGSSVTCSIDAFVAKLDPSLSGAESLVYSTYIGSAADDRGEGIAVDDDGNAHIAGLHSDLPSYCYPEPCSYYTYPFPTTACALDNSATDDAAFMAKLNVDGSSLVYSTYLDTSGFDYAYRISLDNSASAYVTGHSAVAASHTGSVYVVKLDSSLCGLSSLIYEAFFGDGTPRGIAVSGSGNAYVTGGTSASDFPTTADAHDSTLGGTTDAFVSVLDATGSNLTYSTYLGGSGGERGKGVALDASGNIYITGNTGSTNFPTTPDAYQGSPGGTFGFDAFLTKLGTGEGIGVSSLESGRYGTPVKSKDASVVFVAGDTLGAGDNIIIRAYVADGSTGLPVENATVEIALSGPESLSLITSPSGADGWAYADWQTHATADKKGNEATNTGLYTATITNVVADGFHWDGVGTGAQFSLQ